MFEALLVVLGAGLSIWEHKEKTKYVNKLMDLKREWYEEYNKPDSIRSTIALDNIEFELRVLSLGFAAEVGTKNSVPKS
jgi:hypothetical protein